MCGIAGIVSLGADRFVPNLQFMTDSLFHRGPDGGGKQVFAKCLLGHRRLSVVDISGGGQPMLSAEEDVAVTFNGEIYGFKEICSSLSYPFCTNSDTEVILALYMKFGVSMLPYLPGMFAFALWDNCRQTLFCARDRFGEKPFFYATGDNGEFVFASEIKAVLASQLVTPRIDMESLSHYLQRLYVPVDKTIYANIHSLPPAHSLTLRNGKVSVTPYWKLPDPLEMTLPEAEEQFRHLFGQAVKRQLVADVEVGAFLSGGLDSSSIVGVASEQGQSIKAFSFGFGDGINELPLARKTAHHFGCTHIELEDNMASIASLLEQMVLVYDEPFADSSNIPTYLLSKLASQHVKVVLTGDGADELLGGYSSIYGRLESAKNYRKYPGAQLLPLAVSCLQKMRLRIPSFLQRGASLAILASHPNINIARWTNSLAFSQKELADLGVASPHVPLFPSAYDSVDDAMRADLVDYMPGDVLTKVDRATMACGLESRAPFLDKDLAEFCIGLPWSLKISSTKGKVLLRNSLKATLPRHVLDAPKQGFGAPVSSWLQHDDVSELLKNYVTRSNASLRNLLNPDTVDIIVKENSYRTWILLCLGMWLDCSNKIFRT